VDFQGVNNYPADIPGYLAGGSRNGARNMVSQVARAVSQCSGNRVFLIGYSQGSQVAHLAAADILSSQYGVINCGFVFFGDPNKGNPLPGPHNNVFTIRNIGDLICEGIPLPIGTHLTYQTEAPRAAGWIGQRV
ncbi:cutinase, partial [Geopyxis carbonaria]